jgi:hypothetical protein
MKNSSCFERIKIIKLFDYLIIDTQEMIFEKEYFKTIFYKEDGFVQKLSS